MKTSAREVLAWSSSTVQPALKAAVDTLPNSMGRIARYHFGWSDEHDRPTRADGGKAIRPALVLLTAEATGGAVASAVPAAVAVELVHNFSLLHDDVMDGDVTRRHRATAWTVFGQAAAILAGDALLTLAFDVLAGTESAAANESIRTLSTAVLGLIDGQAADLAFEVHQDVSPAECLAMSRRKTAALLGCSCAMGARFGGGTPDQIKRLRGFGEQVGLAFQHVDDILGIWGDPAVTGKPVYSDLRNRKKSLPVVAALNSGTPAGRELGGIYQSTEPLDAAELARAAQLVDLAGGRSWSQAQADKLLEQALTELRQANLKSPAEAKLHALAHLVARRER